MEDQVGEETQSLNRTAEENGMEANGPQQPVPYGLHVGAKAK
jgi:hypothetical protein